MQKQRPEPRGGAGRNLPGDTRLSGWALASVVGDAGSDPLGRGRSGSFLWDLLVAAQDPQAPGQKFAATSEALTFPMLPFPENEMAHFGPNEILESSQNQTCILYWFQQGEEKTANNLFWCNPDRFFFFLFFSSSAESIICTALVTRPQHPVSSWSVGR